MRCAATATGVLAAVGGGLALTPAARAAAPADSTGAAVGTATASGVRTSYDLPGFLVVDQLFDGGGPISQSVVNATGGATSFASVPYPGDTVVNLPAVANVGTGQAFPFTYPFYVVTDGNLTQKASAQDATGTLAIDAASHDRTAHSSARAAGPTAGVVRTTGSTQTSAVEIASDGSMTSTADSLTRGIDIGVLKIAEVHVRSVSVLKPGQSKPTTTSTTDVTGASVLGQEVGIGPNGIVLPAAGQGPADKPVLDAMNDALKQSGLTVSLAGAQDVAGGASAAGVQIVQRGALPFHGSPVGVARTVIGDAGSWILGDSNSLTPLAELSGSGPLTGASAPAVTGAATPSVGAGAAGPAVAPVGFGTDPAAGAGGVPTVLGAPVGEPPRRTVSLAATPTVNTVASLSGLRGRIGALYLITAVGAGLALLFSLLWRVKGVR